MERSKNNGKIIGTLLTVVQIIRRSIDKICEKSSVQGEKSE